MATVNHNFGGTNSLIAIPISGTVTVTVLDSSSSIIGQTTTDRNGHWNDSFSLPQASYTVRFQGAFRPVGSTSTNNFYANPTTQVDIPIQVRIQDEQDEQELIGSYTPSVLHIANPPNNDTKPILFVPSGVNLKIDSVYSVVSGANSTLTFQLYWRTSNSPGSGITQPVFSSAVITTTAGVEKSSGWLNQENGSLARWLIYESNTSTSGPTALWLYVRWKIVW